MILPIIREESCFSDIKKWIEGGASTQVILPGSGFTLLHVAAEFQCIEAIEYLIELGMDPNIVDSNDQTPLHLAVDMEIDSTVQTGAPLVYRTTKRLLELGADLNMKNSKGETPMDCVNGYGEEARRGFDELIGGEVSI